MYEDTNNVIHAAAIPELSIPPDSKLSLILNRIAERIEAIEQKLDNEEVFPSAPTINSTDNILHPGLGDKSSDAIALAGSSLKITTAKNESDVTVTYDAHAFEVPEGSQIVATRINIAGQKRSGRTQIINTKNANLDVDVAFNRFPVTLDARVTVATPRGDVELQRSVVISSDKEGSQVAPYDVTDRSATGQVTVLTDTLKQIDERLKRIETDTNGE